jgi:hypothetical protein
VVGVEVDQPVRLTIDPQTHLPVASDRKGQLLVVKRAHARASRNAASVVRLGQFDADRLMMILFSAGRRERSSDRT